MISTSEQARAVLEAAGVRRRPDLVEVSIVGDDARSWLNGQVTNDVRHTSKGQTVYCLAVTVKGKIMADVWMLDRGDELSVLLPEATAERVLESFESQIIMEDVELERSTGTAILSVQGPAASAVIASAQLEADSFSADEVGVGGYFVVTRDADRALEQLLNADPAALEIDSAGWELARIKQARPRFGVDFDERHYPQEAGLKERAVSFSKGCYLGQEVVCTLESRGRLSKQLVALQGEQQPDETQLLDADGKPIGAVTSGVLDEETGQWLGLGYVKRAHADGKSALTVGGVTVTLRP